MKLNWLVLPFALGICQGTTPEEGIVSKFLPRNSIRWSTFVHALRLMRQRKLFKIIETGCMRSNFGACLGDGCSTAIFAEWVQANPGSTLDSVDISLGNVLNARNLLQTYSNVTVHNANSLDFLKSKTDGTSDDDRIDLLYLDSFDFQSFNPMPSQMHHLSEITIAYPRLHRNSVVMVDDCTLPHGGKCRLVDDFLQLNGWVLDASSYQKIWVATDKTLLKVPSTLELMPNNGLKETQKPQVQEVPIETFIRSLFQYRDVCQARPVSFAVEVIIRRAMNDTNIVEVLEHEGSSHEGQEGGEKAKTIFGQFNETPRLKHLNVDRVYYGGIQWEGYHRDGINLAYFHSFSHSNLNDIYEALLTLSPKLAKDAFLVFDFCQEAKEGVKKVSMPELLYDIHFLLRRNGYTLLEKSLYYQIWLGGE